MTWLTLDESYMGDWKDDLPHGKGEHIWGKFRIYLFTLLFFFIIRVLLFVIFLMLFVIYLMVIFFYYSPLNNKKIKENKIKFKLCVMITWHFYFRHFFFFITWKYFSYPSAFKFIFIFSFIGFLRLTLPVPSSSLLSATQILGRSKI